MIRINLLPVRASKKKETVRQQISILGLSVGGVLLLWLVLYFIMLSKISDAKSQIDSSDNELKQLKSKIGTINNIKKLQDDVKKKLDVLNQLRRGKTGPAARLAALSDSVPDRLWLTKYAESGQSVSVSGLALSEDLIAVFMKNLQASGAFTNVELQVSEQSELPGGIKAKRFDLVFQIAPGAGGVPEPPPQPGKK